MARKRKKEETTATNEAAADSDSSSAFVCPECGRTFGRAAALGAHRKRAHGVAGTSRSASKTSRRRSSRTSPGPRRNTRANAVPASTGANGRARSRRQTAAVDRDALLRSLFPNGIPPKEDVVRSVNAWLDEAERLSDLA